MKYSNYLTLIFVFIFSSSYAQLSEKQLDSLVNETFKTFQVPGISVGIIENGNIIYAKSHGDILPDHLLCLLPDSDGGGYFRRSIILNDDVCSFYGRI